MTQHSPDVAIIGGGVIGCACAWALARAGVSVTLYERGALGGEASGASAGILAPLAESDSPGPFADLAVAGLFAFAEEIDALVAESGIDPEYRRCGVIRLALDERDAEGLRRASVWQSNQKLGLQWVDADRVTDVEPALAPSFGALLSDEEAMVRPALLVRALATAAARRGARIIEQVAAAEPVVAGGLVSGVRLAGGREEAAGAVLLAGGAWTPGFVGIAPGSLPIMPVKGQYALLSIVPRPLRHAVFAGHGYLAPRVDGTIYAGATQEDAGFDRRVTLDGLATVLEMARAILPALRHAEVVGHGAGLRPGSADGLPAIGRVPDSQNLYVAAGHFRNGVLMSLITGRLMAELILGREPSIDLTPFDPARHVAAPTHPPATSPKGGGASPARSSSAQPMARSER